jgi:hypothetical protein
MIQIIGLAVAVVAIMLGCWYLWRWLKGAADMW